MQLKSNPGGRIPIQGILGRDALCSNAWKALEVQSLLISAERRLGKTSVLRKMKAEAPEEWVVFSRDLESLHHASDFANAVYQDVEQHLSRWKRLADRARKTALSLGGTEVGGLVKLPTGCGVPWKQFLVGAIESLVREQLDTRLVFFWDEVPFMLQGIAAREGEETAMEILDVLRSLRQQHESFRVVLTGSIGLHHVLGHLKDRGYANAPVNDMFEIEVPPLEPLSARELAEALLLGEDLVVDSKDATVEAIVLAADCIPFYIHHIVRQLSFLDGPVDPQTVEEVVERQLMDANDPWSLGHYRDRLRTYYPGGGPLVRTILDILATSALPLTTDEILRGIAATREFDDRERLLELLRLLERDHYLQRSIQGYSWKFPLIARWWRFDRDLELTEEPE